MDPNVPLVSSGRDAVMVPPVSVTEQPRVYGVYSTPTPHSSADFGFPRNFVLKKLGDIYLELSLNPDETSLRQAILPHLVNGGTTSDFRPE